ncbi:MAG: response regulator, partial [Deferribacterales bacterium]
KDLSNLSDFIFDAYLNNEEIKSLLYKGVYLNENPDEVRSIIYKKLYPVFLKSKDMGISQFAFHTNDGRSFLRLHNPQKYGDDLTSIRPMIKSMVKYKRKISGYEVGKHEFAYRIIYPIKYYNKYIGSVEIALNATYLLKYLNKEFNHLYQIASHKDYKNIIDPNFYNSYYISPFNNYFVIREIYNINPYNVNLLKSKMEKYIDKDDKKSRSIFLMDKAITLIPFYSYDNNFIGYLIKIQKTDMYHYHLKNTLVEIVLIFIISILLLIGYYNINKKNELLKEENLKRETLNKELEKLNKLFTIIIENSGQIIYDYNLETKMVKQNGAIESILGIEKERFSETDTNIFFELHPEDKIRVLNLLSNETFEDGRSFKIRYRLKNTKGDYVQILDTGIYAIIDGERHFVGTMKDITYLIEYEETLQRNKRLESLGFLAGGIAHDFNNLLAGIWAYIEIIRMSQDKATIEDCINKAYTAFKRAKTLINQLLTFSKCGTPELKVVDTKKLVTDTVNFAMAGSSAKIHFDIAEDTYNILADEHQIAQVIENLIINARQASSDKGNIYIKVYNIEKSNSNSSMCLNLEDGKYVHISISDDGVGIPEDKIQHIFEPFYTTKSKGKGLGLAICHNIIEKHKGCIKASSKPGELTTFEFYIPATSDKTLIKEEQIDISKKGSLKIALMDDEDIILDAGKLLFETLGHTVFTAKTGEEMIKLYNEHLNKGERFNLCILDITIVGGMGGIDTIKELKKIDPNVRAIVSSGYAEDPVFANFKEYGFVATLKKPYGMPEVIKALDDTLYKH